MTDEYTQRLFGTESDGVLYLPESVMKSAKLKPGDTIRIIPEKTGFRVQVDSPRPGGPT